MGIWYTTREDVMSAQDIKATAYAGRDIDRAVEAASREAESMLHRVFYPWTGTRYFDYPGNQGAPSWRLWFGRHDLVTLAGISTNDGVTIPPANTYLDPQDGPPYDSIQINRGTNSVFSSGTTSQRAVAVTGVWGWSLDEETAGAMAEDIDLTETQIDAAGMPTVGVGSVIRVDSERMVVTDKAWLTTGQTGSLTVQNNAQTLAVSNGAAFVAGETILLDAERIRIVDIAGNNLSVRRAVDGTTLAAHTNATIYAMRLLTVTRGALGTTAATHSNGATAYRWLPPGPVAELTLAYAIDALLQRQSGYARTVGSGENEQEQSGRGIRALEKRARTACGRMARTAAV